MKSKQLIDRALAIQKEIHSERHDLTPKTALNEELKALQSKLSKAILSDLTDLKSAEATYNEAGRRAAQRLMDMDYTKLSYLKDQIEKQFNPLDVGVMKAMYNQAKQADDREALQAFKDTLPDLVRRNGANNNTYGTGKDWDNLAWEAGSYSPVDTKPLEEISHLIVDLATEVKWAADMADTIFQSDNPRAFSQLTDTYLTVKTEGSNTSVEIAENIPA